MKAAKVVGRRGVLAGAVVAGAAGLLSGCRTGGEQAASPPRVRTATRADPDVALVQGATADEQRLLSYLQEVHGRFAGLRPTLAPMIQRQQVMVSAFQAALSKPASSSSPSTPPTPTQSSAAPHRSPQIPPHQADSLALLHRLTLAAERDRAANCQRARSGALASLLASSAASHAVSAELLRRRR